MTLSDEQRKAVAACLGVDTDDEAVACVEAILAYFGAMKEAVDGRDTKTVDGARRIKPAMRNEVMSFVKTVGSRCGEDDPDRIIAAEQIINDAALTMHPWTRRLLGIHLPLSLTEAEAIHDKAEQLARSPARRGRNKTTANRVLIRQLGEVYEKVTGRKPSQGSKSRKADKGPFMRYLDACGVWSVMTTHRGRQREVEKALKPPRPPKLDLA